MSKRIVYNNYGYNLNFFNDRDYILKDFIRNCNTQFYIFSRNFREGAFMNAKDRIRELCKDQNIKPYNLECELGFSHSTLTKGEDITAKRLLAVAKYFNVTMEYLMGEDTKVHSISDFEFQMIEAYRKAQPGIQNSRVQFRHHNRMCRTMYHSSVRQHVRPILKHIPL